MAKVSTKQTKKERIYWAAIKILQKDYRELLEALAHNYTANERELCQQIMNSSKRMWTNPLIKEAIEIVHNEENLKAVV